MTRDTLEDVEDAIERATELEESEALELLRSARQDLRELTAEGAVDDERAAVLEDTLTQRIREVSERDRYDTDMGAAMNPDEEDAP
ncbi:hypothetical protein ACYJ1Y_12425 [Natrialbaceae archaeon A-gly3]